MYHHYDKIYVYYLMDPDNHVLYIGQTGNPKQRLKGHRSNKNSPGYKRYDVRLEIICIYDNRYDAKMLEHHLQKVIFVNQETDLEKNLRGCYAGAANPQREGRIKGGKAGGIKSGPMISNRLYHMSCGRSIRTKPNADRHAKVCGCEIVSMEQLGG